ncbi:MAG: hypothetical protein EOO27_04760 [Comamonadaceae bacterium]|nr:MAG: hypothetical protein EOO27_04760 [Comamonadaceae bacterium]
MKNTNEAPSQAPTNAERLDAMEFLLGQMALQIEADSTAIRAQLHRLHGAIERSTPQALCAPQEEEDAEPFTVGGLCSWVQTCVERMHAHQSATARQMLAIGEVTMRVTALGELLGPPVPLDIAAAAHALVERAQHRPPGA